ncbi:MAG: hypothetical protein CMM94_04005 [Rickettsiales bacterium]|nr:hypothetical protein [Rickettsiales bacterium]|tara:strand:- start:314 stop:646 length:333 start_codon:yes stop_codon:yes gene_type:complete
MHPLLLFLLALVIPTITVVLILAPTYIGILVATYLKYGDKIMPYKYDMFRIIDVWVRLKDFYFANSDKLDFVDHALPIFGPPVVGVLLTIFLVYKFVTYVINIFRLTSSD